MKTGTFETRLERIEARRLPAPLPPWVSVATADDIPAALAALDGAGSVKVYIGISPNDWDGVA